MARGHSIEAVCLASNQAKILSVKNFQDKINCDKIQMRILMKNLPRKRSIRNGDIQFLSTDLSSVRNLNC